MKKILLLSFFVIACTSAPNEKQGEGTSQRKETDLLEILEHWGVVFPREQKQNFNQSGGRKDIGYVLYKQISIALRSQDRKEYLSRRCSVLWKFSDTGQPSDLDIEKRYSIVDSEIREVYQKTEVFKEPALYPVEFGYHFIFKEGVLDEVTCHQPITYFSEKCDDSMFLNPDGTIREVKTHKTKCKQGCAQFQPIRLPGTYYIATNQVRIRDKASTKGKILRELSKDTKVEVIADAETYEYVGSHFATWAQVKLDDGKVGYVYGAFLRAPGEPDVVAIKEKAEIWKKENGMKGK
ncbi:MAG: SH3 domain-containing protein [Leptospira sp.]|nr:SH3 domain-containing protein [Leptospira sp.]